MFAPISKTQTVEYTVRFWTAQTAAPKPQARNRSEPSDTTRARLLECVEPLWHSRFVVTLVIFLFGLIIGSFLNVCIVRIPAEESIVRPRSHCPVCQSAIKPFDNIPVLSWLLLGGKCRKCGTRISFFYPAIEILTGLLFVGVYRIFG